MVRRCNRFVLITDAWPLIPAGGGGRTRTYEGVSQRIYSPPPLPLGTLPRCGLVKHSQFPKQWPTGRNGRIGKRLAHQMFCPRAKTGATMDRDADAGGIHANSPDCCNHACGHVFIRHSRACRRYLVRAIRHWVQRQELRLLLLRAMPCQRVGDRRVLPAQHIFRQCDRAAQALSAR